MEKSPQAVPLAAGILRSFASDIELLEIRMINFTLKDTPDRAARSILSEKPGSVGFSVYLWNSLFFRELSEVLRTLSPDLILYCGGPEMTEPDIIQWENCDYIIPGEGESGFRELMLHLTGRNENPPPAIMKSGHLLELDQIPSPYLNGIIPPGEYEGLIWELSRGCPFRCSFCAESRGIAGVRYHSLERIAQELDFFENHQLEQVFILDPTFNVNRDRTLAILSLIAKKTPAIHYTIEIRAEFLDDETAEAFSRIHCSLQIGLQSCHNSVLKKLNRSMDKKRFAEKMDLLNRYGIVFGLDLIYGLPGDTVAGFMESLDYALECLPNHLDIFRLSVFKGTELFDQADGYGLNFSKEPPYNVLCTETITAEELDELDRLALSFDFFYNKGKAAPWFLPLTDLLGIPGSRLIQMFHAFFHKYSGETREIVELQTEFVTELLQDDDNDTPLAVMMDLVLFNHLFSKCLQEIPGEKDSMFNKEYSGPYHRGSSFASGIFSYDVTLYYELGMIDIEWFIDNYDREVSYGFFYNDNGNVQVLSLDRNLYLYLQSLDGVKTDREIAALTGSSLEELDEFITFLGESGFILPSP